MVTLVVATTADPASVGPASALLAMPGWHLGPSLEVSGAASGSIVVGNGSGGLIRGLMKFVRWVNRGGEGGLASYTNGGVRLLQHGNSIVAEDDLDRRWEEAMGEKVEEVIFLSRHAAVTNRPALTVHPIGVPHLREDEVPLQGGRPGWASLPNPRMGPWIRLLKRIADAHGLTPEFEVTLEATHHGPVVNTPTMFVEIGSTEEYWGRQDAAQVIALVQYLLKMAEQIMSTEFMSALLDSAHWRKLLWEGLGLDGGGGLGHWDSGGGGETSRVLLGLGGGHYVPRHMDIVAKDGVWVGHMLSGYSLPMEDPSSRRKKEGDGGSNRNSNRSAVDDGIGGTWKEAITTSFAATKAAFPGGQIIAHLDHKSFKGWQKNAITSFLAEQNIRVGKPADFFS